MKTAAIYARVSTSGQTTDNQVHELRKVARRHGLKIDVEYIDHSISDAKGRGKRPELGYKIPVRPLTHAGQVNIQTLS